MQRNGAKDVIEGQRCGIIYKMFRNHRFERKKAGSP